MTLFDLLFLAAALCTLIVLMTAAVEFIRGHRSAALRLLRAWSIALATYVVAGVLVSYFRPPAIRPIGEAYCLDDWCLTVRKAQLTSTAAANTYRVDLLIESRAKRIVQRASGAWIYILDANGRRYSPEASASDVPLDVVLQPQQTIATERTFRLPPDTRAVGLVTGHGGPYCGPMSLLVIGDSGCLFHKPPMIGIE